jgi:predicted membrane protein
MKMGFLFSGIFWGVVLMLLGLSIIVKMIFHIDIPVFRTIFALVLIYLGLRLLFGWNWCHKQNCHSTWFNNSTITATAAGSKYDVIFGQSKIDLRNITAIDGDREVNVDVVFGSADVLMNPNVPYIIKSDVVFGAASMPGQGDFSTFGEREYTSKAYVAGQPHVVVKLDVVFGRADVRE